MRFIVIVGMIAGSMGLVGCASAPYVPSGQARYVLVEKSGGVVALPRRESDRSHALYMIRSKCGTQYEIVREEEVEVGEIERVSNQASNGGNSSVGSSVIVREKKVEYRISYKCK
uniref:DUF4156 domain-containing protein n=1 Tax=Candidatus Kentrum sp. LFY TaxID=2126342 RepID=A0A450UGY6_9GAMM|nr:MAG: hypothetical protein BECKLFY1418A_GA0070994_101818 [Candidatus Kentron sp. LFY]